MHSLSKSWLIILAVGLILAALIFSCSTDRTTKAIGNTPPETHLYIVFSDTLQMPGETTSMQVLHWYGDDPDGEVIGFEYKWNYDCDTCWTFTTDVTDTFFVPIRVPHDTFTFEIRAVDNVGLRDATPAHLSFPIMNSSPTVAFPISFVQRFAHVTYNCFSYFSIGWTGSDPDGDATITGYYWYLADSSFHVPIDSVRAGRRYWNQDALNAISWERLDSLTSLKVFNNLQPGSYRFFLRCRDVADAYSNPIIYPDTDGVWNVMPVLGTVLFVDDDRYASAIDTVILNSIRAIYGPDTSVWQVFDRISYYPRDIEETLRLFPVIVWHGGSYPHFRDASDAINRYLGTGGHLLAFSTQRYEGDTTIYPFMPVDSFTTPRIGRSFTLARVTGAPAGYPDTLSSNVPGYPTYPLSKSSGFRPGSPSGLLPGTFEALYTQRADAFPSQIDTVAARYPASNGGAVRAQIVYFSMELYLCSARFGELLSYILEQEFGNAGP